MPRSSAQETTLLRTEWAWLAGLYEGEGSLVRKLNKRSGVESWELSITSTDSDVILHAQDTAGVGTVTFVARQRSHWQDKYRWRTGSRDEIAFAVGMLLPHLGKRRLEQAVRFLEWYRVRQLHGAAALTKTTAM